MTQNTTAERLSAIGFFDLHPSLAGLLHELAAFLERHRVGAPRQVSWSQDPSRGWKASLLLDPADFIRVLADAPLPARVSVAGEELRVEMELRSATIATTLALDGTHAVLTSGGVLIRQGLPPAHDPTPAGARIVMGPR